MIQQSREQLEQAFSSLGSTKSAAKQKLIYCLVAVAMLVIGIVIGVVIGYDLADTEKTPTKDNVAPAIELMNQVTAIDSAAEVSVTIGDSAQTYTVIKQDSVK